MRIYDIEGNIIENPNLDIGHLVEKQRAIVHRYNITQKEVGHYKVIKEYSNGGKDVEWVIDTPEEGNWITYDIDGNQIECDIIVPDDAPHEMDINDVENYLLYVLYTEEELKQKTKEETASTSPSQLDIIEAQVAYTAMMTDTLLEV